MQTDFTSGQIQDIPTPEHSFTYTSSTIRLISATPSDSGRSSMDALPPMLQSSSEDPWEAAGLPARLAPKPSDADAERKKRLVPRKSKLGLISSSISGRDKNKSQDFSDAVRRVGAPPQSSSSLGGGFEIYVDSRPKSPEQEDDEDIAEVVVVRKKKSRMALDGVAWSGPLNEVTNAPSTSELSKKKSTALKKEKEKKENEGGRGSVSGGLMKMKSEMDAKDKWWSIGRGRKELKEVKEELKEKKKRTKSPGPEEATKGKSKDKVRSKTPEPLRRSNSSGPEKTLRTRFHSMDFGTMFKSANSSADISIAETATSTSVVDDAEPVSEPQPQEPEELTTPKASTSSRKTKISGGHQRKGSIAVRAMKSFQSLARMGSWNQLKHAGMKDYQDDATDVDNVEATPKERRKDKDEPRPDGSVKEKKSKKSIKEGKDKSSKSSKSSKSTSSSTKKKRSINILSASAFDPPGHEDDTVLGPAFEFNPTSEAKDPSLGRKRSILGIGLPSTLSKMTGRLQHKRSGSTASSIFTTGSDGEPRQPATLSGRSSRLSLTSAKMLFTHGRSSSRAAFDSSTISTISRERSASVMSNHTGGSKGSVRSSLRPPSITSSILARAALEGDRRSSSGSVRWDESVLESVKERRDQERIDTEKAEQSEKQRLKEEKEKRREERAQKRAEKEKRREEKEKRREEKEKKKEEKEKKKAEKEKKRAEEAEEGTISKKSKKDSQRKLTKSKKTSIADIFSRTENTTVTSPDVLLTPTQQLVDRAPVIRKKAATSDGYPMRDTDSVIGSILEQAIKEEDSNEVTVAPTKFDTPKKHRRRPMSEQLLGRPVALSDDDGEALTVLDAATNDLAQLISKLDLEATPGTPDRTPNKITRTFKLDFNAPPVPSRDESPVRRASAGPSFMSPLEAVTTGDLKRAPSYMAAGPSLRPYAQSRKNTLGHSSRPSQSGIPAWPVPEGYEEQQTHAKSHSLSSPPALIIGALTSPLLPPAEITPSQVFFPPPSATSEKSGTLRAKAFSTSATDDGTVKALSKSQPRPSLADVFGGPESSDSSQEDSVRRSPVFRRPESTPGSSARNSSQFNNSHRSEPPSFMGDIPAELHELLASSNADDALSFFERASVISPSDESPMLPGSSMANSMIPFDASILNAEPIDFTGGVVDETKRSFDFTAEIRNLRESSGFEHQSFVEQLENAFGTPAKVNYSNSRDESRAPTLPEIPSFLRPSAEADDAYSVCQTDETGSSQFEHGDLMDLNMMAARDTPSSQNSELPFGLSSWSSHSQLGNPTLLPDSASFASSEHSEDVMMDDASVSHDDHPSRGELNMSFRFGGLPKVVEPDASLQVDDHPRSLADIIPPLSHLSPGNTLPIPLSPARSPVARRRVRVSSDSSIHRLSAALNFSPGYNPDYRHSRAGSELSFMGFESFDEVRRGFEFGRGQPRFWPPVAGTEGRRFRPQSMFSINSVSSYGRPHDYGLDDPFGYGSLSFNERPQSDAFSILSNTVDDTFSFLRHGRRPQRSRADSDASSFSFRAPLPAPATHRDSRRFSAMSVTGHAAPPVALVTRGFGGRRRNDSTASVQSRGRPFSGYATSSKRFSWTRQRRDSSDSAMSDFSISKIIRPGLGDKMFDNPANYRMSLASIPASPECPRELPSIMDRSFQDDTDSLVDHEESRFNRDDSIFSKIGDNFTSHSLGSVFGGSSVEKSSSLRFELRPLSTVSDASRPSPIKESELSFADASPLGHFSVAPSPDSSPCSRVEKRKRVEDAEEDKALDVPSGTPNKARIVEEPIVVAVAASPLVFGEEPMIEAQQGLIKSHSFEESCSEAKDQEASVPLFNGPVFSRPGNANRSRSSTCTSNSGRETPSLTSAGSDSFSSMDFDEDSGVDLSDLNLVLNTMQGQGQVRIRTRSRPSHSRQSSYARASIYEPIEEEITAPTASPTKTGLLGPDSTMANTTTRRPVFLNVDDDAASIRSTKSRVSSIWEDNTGVIALRKYYALKNEAESIISESRQQWSDTQGSMFALKSFQPPKQAADMRALLEESLQAFQPMTSELRSHRVRSRTSSRVSPYPASRPSKVLSAAEDAEPVPSMPAVFSRPAPPKKSKSLLKDVTTKSNLAVPVPTADGHKLFPSTSNSDLKREPVFSRPRVFSGGRKNPATPQTAESKSIARVASKEFKENTALGTLTPADALKFRRPRPRGRPTNGAIAKPIRV